MIRRYNYTGRKALSRADAQVFVEEQPLQFEAVLRLGDYELPDDAKVFVEAYRQTSWMRFDFGIVAAIEAPADCRLTEFETRDGVLFRVKVTAASAPTGRLLAEADQLSPLRQKESDEQPREPLLPIKPEDLGEETFRVDYAGERPILKINKRAGDWRTLARHPAFVCLVLPEVLREILTRVLSIEEYYETEDDSDWRARWLRFGSLIPGSSEPPASKDEEDRFDDWVNDAVAAFARLHHMRNRFNLFWSGGAES